MDLHDYSEISKASQRGQNDFVRLGLALLFIIGAVIYSTTLGHISLPMMVAAGIGAYMAMNIGANDVANNVGPAVGSKALTMGGALVIAAVCEAAGALIAGGEVVSTIRSGIIDPSLIPDKAAFIWIMMSALLAAALWLNVATLVGAPVSTTHSIVGALLGAGVMASGFGIANWGKVVQIAASWVISPVMGGIVAAGFLYFIKRTITYQSDMRAAAARIVPVLIGLMVGVFAAYLMLKGLSKLWKVGFVEALLAGAGLGVVSYLVLKPIVARRAARSENTKQAINALFTWPLIMSAALLSFAHGSNDVANAIGPLAAIVDALQTSGSEIGASAGIPLWVMLVGALGISVGLALFGPKVIRTVGNEITELDQMRAYSIAMSATVTVILASQLGLPVSSTHIAVGGVFGIGFLREHLKNRYAIMIAQIKAHHPEDDQPAIDAFIKAFTPASIEEKGQMLRDLKQRMKALQDPAHFSKRERKELRQVYKTELVKRSLIKRIAAAWVITVPASALMSAGIFLVLQHLGF